MKKTFLAMTALAAMLFAGCTSSDDLTTRETITQANEAATPINFGTYMGKTSTRAGATGDIITPSTGATNELGTAGKEFGVIAYNTGSTDWAGTGNTVTPNFMYNQKVSCTSGTTWTYAPIKYWPNGVDAGNNTSGNPSKTATQGTEQKLSFFAYAPYVDAIVSTGAVTPATEGITGLTSNNIAGEPKVTYKLNVASGKTAADNVDLLWGLAGKTSYNEADNDDPSLTVGTSYNINLTKQNSTEKINFLFKHALAKIGGLNGLKVQLDVDNNTGGALDAKSNVSIQKIVIKGVEDKIATSGTFNIATGTWEGVTLDTSYPETTLYDVDNTTPGVDANIFTPVGTPFTYSTSSTSWNCPGVTNTAQSIFNSGTQNEFYLLPGVNGQQLKVVITYQVRTYDTNLNGNYSTVDQTITNIITLPTLAVNHYYTLIMHLGLTSVKFEASVDGWDTDGAGEEKKIWLPSNVVE